MNYYQILGVSYSATFNEIKEAYRKKVKEFHPDKENGNAEIFIRLKEAYEILKNDEKRRKYDEQLFKASNDRPNHTTQDVYSKSEPAITVIHLRRKSSKRVSLSTLTFHSALIMIGIMGKNYVRKRKSKY